MEGAHVLPFLCEEFGRYNFLVQRLLGLGIAHQVF